MYRLKRARRAFEGRGLYRNQFIEGGPPAVRYSGAMDETGSLRISGSEYVGDIYGPGDSKFTLLAYELNPGLSHIFKRLAYIADQFEEYEFIQLMWEFRSMVESNQTDSGLNGELIMCTQYNPGTTTFENKSEMLQYVGSRSGKLTKDMLHGVECDPKKNPGDGHKYVRFSPVVENEDIKSYDHGIFQLAIVDCPSQFQNQRVGELRVSYTVALHKRRVTPPAKLLLKDVYVSNGGENMQWNAAAASILPLGTNILSGQQNNLGCLVENTGSARSIDITFPASYAGNVEITVCAEGYGLSVVSSGVAPGAEGCMGTGRVEGVSGVTIASTTSITKVNDMYGNSNVPQPSGTSPTWIRSAATWAPSSTVLASSASSAAAGITAVMHFQVQAATAGVDNKITILFPWALNTLYRMEVTVQEYNFQYGKATTTPVFIDGAGNVTVPTAYA